MRSNGSLFALLLSLAALGCGGGATGDDAGPPDSGGDTDAGSEVDAGMDAGAIDDAGGADAQTGDAEIDAGPEGTDAAAACGGGECAGYPAAFERGCTLGAGGADVNCAPELHQIDCCGTMRAIGINHGVVATAFCPAEEACRATYPAVACDPGPITTDTGDTTEDVSTIHVRCNIPAGGTVGTCETYVAGPGGGVGSCGV